MLALPRDGLTVAAARSAINARALDMAAALLEEAAQSDDVTSAETALDYLEDRLAYLADFVPADAAADIRSAFAEGVEGW